MNALVFGALCILAVVLPSEAQFFDAGDCTAGRGLALDPFLLQALKSKFPKKYNAKLDMAKDLALDAKYRLGAAKLLARHMKNLNAVNYDLQNLMYQQQQPGIAQSLMAPDQSSLLAQQSQLANLQIPYDTSRSYGLAPQPDAQLSCFSQVTDPRLQHQAYQLASAQSTRSTRRQSQCSCEEGCGCGGGGGGGRGDRGHRPDVLSSVLSAFVGVMKNILK